MVLAGSRGVGAASVMKTPPDVRSLGLTFLVAGALVAGALTAVACGAGKATQAAAPAAKPAPPLTPAPSATFASSTSTSAGSSGEIIIGERVGLKSAVLEEERALLVYRPPPERPDARYPVIYLLDGDAHFHHVTGLVQFLMQQGLMPRVIVVGISNVDRARDFTPVKVPEVPTSGGADRFIAFLDRELIPAVDAAYPTADYRILIGHSLGGLLAVHAMNHAPDIFDAYISISPSLQHGKRAMQSATEARIAKSPGLEEVLYLTIGTEGPDLSESNRAYAAMLRQRAPRGLRWMFEEMKWEDHGSIVHRGVHRGLELVFAGWRAPPEAAENLAGLERHYRSLAARFRIPAAPPEVTVNLLGYRLLAARRTEEALAVFRRNVELYPDSPNVHDSLGEALEQKGDLTAALESYERAINNAARNRDPLLEVFMQHRARAKARIGAQAQPDKIQ